MARLRVTLPNELRLEFTCSGYDTVKKRAKAFVGVGTSIPQAKCRSNRDGAVLEFSPADEGENNWHSRSWDTPFDGFFFDNADYNVYAKIDGQSGFRHLGVKSRFAVDEGNKKFAAFENGKVRAGTLNFENDIGQFDFTLQYVTSDNLACSFTFTGEVLSQKLDARRDWKTMIDDVEGRYALLAADYLKRTYHSFERQRKSDDTPNLIWWNLFAAEQDRFFKAIRTILERPRKKLRSVVEYRRADQIRRMSPVLEGTYAEHRKDSGYLYRLEFDSSSQDTPENRFVKYVIGKIGKKYDELSKFICRESQFGKRISDSERARMDAVRAKFRKVLAHPFFKGVGRFEGLKQLSLTLQNAPGYATVFRTYAILKSSYMFFDGMKRLETKNVADLYEIWCFLKVEEIVKRSCELRYGEYLVEPEANHGELSGKFVKQLGTGARSQVIFKVKDPTGNEDIELARVVYNPKVVDANGGGDNGLPDTIYPTALTSTKGQIPDIVMQLRRDSMNRDESFRLTYLFDAKYRIEDAEVTGNDWTMRPPQDAIDQMHRYRDSIYYAENGDATILDPAEIKREVIGGYVLFPGLCAGEMEKPVQGQDNRPKYFKSIDQVNIGAIPLRPNNGGEYGHLQKFIDKLLRESPTVEAALDRVNPQHGEILENSTQEGVANELLSGTYRKGEIEGWIQKGYYSLPKSEAAKIGVATLEDAKQKRVLALITYTNKQQKPYKILDCDEMSVNDLWQLRQKVGYRRMPTHPEGYYVFKVRPLIESMRDVKDRLKIVTLGKGGVCKGVSDAAAGLGVECTCAASLAAAAPLCDGFVVFDDSWTVPASLRGVLQAANHKSHQPNAMNVKLKKARKVMVQWLRILLRQVTPPRKYVLYIDGRDNDPTLEEKAKIFLTDVLQSV